VPVSIAAPGTDSVYSPKMVKQMEELWKDCGVKFEIVVYEGAKHEMCVKGGMKDEET
jgi:alpha-beta hydrolase superfamily lysophospholipase